MSEDTLVGQAAQAAQEAANAVEAIDMTPTWGEVGLLFIRLAESGERAAVRAGRPDFARAFALAQVVKELKPTLSDAQEAIVARVLAAELTKMGY